VASTSSTAIPGALSVLCLVQLFLGKLKTYYGFVATGLLQAANRDAEDYIFLKRSRRGSSLIW
ncbi:uncharacterized protein METZ01_LOCUS512750, partial [marine metagenome]